MRSMAMSGATGLFGRPLAARGGGASDRPVVIVGGTGLEFHGLTEGLAECPTVPAAVRAEADARGPATFRRCWRGWMPPPRRGSTWPLNPAASSAPGRCCAPPGAGWPTGRTTPRRRCCRGPRPRRWSSVPGVDWLNARIDPGSTHAGGRRAGGGAGEPAGLGPRRPWVHGPSGAGTDRASARRDAAGGCRGAAQLASRQYAKRQRTWFRSNMMGLDRSFPCPEANLPPISGFPLSTGFTRLWTTSVGMVPSFCLGCAVRLL
jgi:tRNA dimethylallyltransferase